jgi:glycosyltransferase involved in cell wall biosynthesis
VVVDDGSTDATAAIAATYAGQNPRVRLVRQAQRGEGAARNAGIAASSGEWLLFLDADDWYSPDAVERFHAGAAAAPDADVLVAPREPRHARRHRGAAAAPPAARRRVRGERTPLPVRGAQRDGAPRAR